MDRESLKQLQLDVRLIRKRGWIAPEELERELAALPDVADKVAPQQPADRATPTSPTRCSVAPPWSRPTTCSSRANSPHP